MIILAVRRRSSIVGVSVVDSFEFCSIYFSITALSESF